jgi:predicted transposase YbfD/YdcC
VFWTSAPACSPGSYRLPPNQRDRHVHRRPGPGQRPDRGPGHGRCDAYPDRPHRISRRAWRGPAGRGKGQPAHPVRPGQAVPWEEVPVGDTQIGARLHHRTDKRVVKVTAIGYRDEQIAFPHARQVAQVTRYLKHKTRNQGRWYWKKTETAYYLCTLDQVALPAARLARAVREHWAIESWHWLRDVTFGEDAHRARSGNIAALRNTAISLLHLAGTNQIARNLRRLARNPDHAISLLTSTNPTLN